MCWYIRVCTGLYLYMLVCTSTYQHVLHIFPPVGIFGYKLVHARLSLLVLSHTALYPLVLFWIRGGTRRYQAVKFGTMRYKAVPESPVPLDMKVQGGTRRYKASYRLVPPYPGVRDFLVLPGTASYRLVSRRGQSGMRENQNLRKCKYVLVHTCTYLYILVHTTHVICTSTN